MSRSRYQPSAIDGIPARVSGAWAREKLSYLDRYTYLFNVGMKKAKRASPNGRVQEDTASYEAQFAERNLLLRAISP